MDSMLMQLEKHLERRDKIGYAAARNTRILANAALEYLKRKEELIRELGEKSDDGSIAITNGSDALNEFLDRIEEWANIEHDVELYTIPFSEAINVLSGSEILEIDWMFEESED